MKTYRQIQAGIILMLLAACSQGTQAMHGLRDVLGVRHAQDGTSFRARHCYVQGVRALAMRRLRPQVLASAADFREREF